MTRYLSGVLTVIAAGVLLIAYGLLAPHTQAAFADNSGIVSVPANAPAQYFMSPMPAGSVAYPMPPTAAPAYAPMTVAQPVGYTMQPAVMRTVESQPATVVRETPRRAATTHTVVRKGSDWKKSAMIIGGSSAAAAGVGGLIGGKKGALIGAAIGGGASTIYETTKR